MHHRRFRFTPSWLIFGLLVVEGLLWLSERYRWFWFNEKKGWTVLIGVAVVGVAMLVMLLWFIVALVFRWRFQFSIRSLLVLTVAVAVPCSWLAVEKARAKRQAKAVAALRCVGESVFYDYEAGRGGYPIFAAEPPTSLWLRSMLGDDFFANVASVFVQDIEVTGMGMSEMLTQITTPDPGFRKPQGANPTYHIGPHGCHGHGHRAGIPRRVDQAPLVEYRRPADHGRRAGAY